MGSHAEDVVVKTASQAMMCGSETESITIRNRLAHRLLPPSIRIDSSSVKKNYNKRSKQQSVESRKRTLVSGSEVEEISRCISSSSESAGARTAACCLTCFAPASHHQEAQRGVIVQLAVL